MAEQVQNEISEVSLGLDIGALADSLFQSIEQMRSQYSANYTELITTPTTNPGGKGESRINAFYRMLGLPALAPAEFTDARLASQDGTLNLFSSLGNDSAIRRWLQVRNLEQQIPISGDEYRNIFHNPPSFDQAILPPHEKVQDDKRSSIFPLVVDAAVPIFPSKRRIAGSFKHRDSETGEDYTPTGQDKRLSRPLIDHIIYIKLKKIELADNKAILEEQLRQLTNSITNEDIKKSVQDTQFDFASQLIRNKLIQILKDLAQKFSEASNNAKQIASKVKFVPKPADHVNRRSAQETAESTLQLYPDGEVDQRIKTLKKAIRENESIIYLLPTEEIKRRELNRLAEHSLPNNNIADDVLFPQLIDMLSAGATPLREELRRKEAEREELISIAERFKKELLYYTGRSTGLSIFDVVGVLYGLFSLKEEHLLGLLNKDAFEALKKDEFLEGSSTPEPAGVVESLATLENKVREAFAIAQAFANTKKTQ